MSFDDWEQMKESLGASDVTSGSPESERVRVLIDGFLSSRPDSNGSPRPLSELEWAVGGYGLISARVHAEKWDFDVLDYVWSATLTVDGPPITVIKLRDDLDMAPVIAHFDEREYATEEVAGVTLRTHDLDLSADWLTGEFAILNVAFLDGDHTLVLSSSGDGVRDYLTTERPEPPAYVLATANALEDPFAAYLLIGAAQMCDGLALDISEADQEVRDLVASAGPLSTWDALGVGYSKKLDPIGRIAFGYADPAAAGQDLEGRRLLAEDGPSLTGNGPLSEVAFVVEDVSVDDGVLRFDVAPREDYARYLLTPVLQRDLVYAACGTS